MANHIPRTCVAVRGLNEQDLVCPAGHRLMQNSKSKKKAEYYKLLLTELPAIVSIIRKLRDDFTLGLVRKEGNQLRSTLKALQERCKAASETDSFLDASYWVHNAIAIAIDSATEIWADNADWSEQNLKRLNELVDPERRAAYGGRAAQKRISSAMIQTGHISASFERFLFLMSRDDLGRPPNSSEMLRMHQRTLRTAAHLTDLHLERTREIRPLVGAEGLDGGIIHRYNDMSCFVLEDDRLELNTRIVTAMDDRPIDSSDGRIGCPGKIHVPEIWQWIEEVSVIHSYSLLD